MELLRQLGLISARRQTYRRPGRQTDRRGVCGRRQTWHRRRTDGRFGYRLGAAAIVAYSHPALLRFITLLQVYPGNSKARPLLKPTTVKVTGNCGTALVKRPVCLKLVSAPHLLDGKLGAARSSYTDVTWAAIVAFLILFSPLLPHFISN